MISSRKEDAELAATTQPLKYIDPGAENELRLRRRLWADETALKAVRGQGLHDATIRRFRFGLNEAQVGREGQWVERALALPVLRVDGERAGRWSFLNLEGVTKAPPHPIAWTPGGVRTLYSRPLTRDGTLLLVPSPYDLFLLWQSLGDTFGSLMVACPSIPGAVPSEWRDPRFWSSWKHVVLGLGERSDENDAAEMIARVIPAEVRRCAPPAGETWADLVRMGGSAGEIRRVIEDAQPWKPKHTAVLPPDDRVVGDFSAEPISIEGAFVGGHLHYPLTIERREIEEGVHGGPKIVQRYVTRMLRSDGAMLDIVRLPAPMGTPTAGRVLALSDGTRIVSAPQPGRFGTWSFESIQRFIAARAEDREPEFRQLPRLLADIELHLRSCIWLPHDEDYALTSLFAAATFVHRAFDAFPILLVNGPRGSGKSELGQAIALVSCNSVVAGRVTPAGLVRLLAESRGTVVLDDLESLASTKPSIDDLTQILKVSYKVSTAKRVSPGRDGRVEVLDFFSPKVVTNIGGADAVLLSRMLTVRTLPMPAKAEVGDYGIEPSVLRDELHVWAMCRISAVRDAYSVIFETARSRQDEIAAPLRAIAELAKGDWLERLERALDAGAPEVAEQVEVVLDRALRRLVCEEGVQEIAMPRLALEMASIARTPLVIPSAETLGRMLLAAGARERDGVVERRRLHGEVTRIYQLSSAYLDVLGRPALPAPNPFAFCSGPCSSCPYDASCDLTVPWLRVARLSRARG